MSGGGGAGGGAGGAGGGGGAGGVSDLWTCDPTISRGFTWRESFSG